MTKRWGPNCTSDLTKTKRRAAKQERAKAKLSARSEIPVYRSNSEQPNTNESAQDGTEIDGLSQ